MNSSMQIGRHFARALALALTLGSSHVSLGQRGAHDGMGPVRDPEFQQTPCPPRTPDESHVARRARIEIEVSGLRAETIKDETGWGAQWAGEYYYGDGLSTNTVVRIAPKSGLVMEGRGCLGPTHADEGDIETIAPDHIRVRIKHSPSWSVDGSGDTDYYFVRWGDRRYLISARNMRAFCGAVNTGRMNPTGLQRRILDPPNAWVALRIDDALSSGYGRPGLPRAFDPLILREPFQCRLTDGAGLASRDFWRDGSVVRIHGRATIDAGRRHGLVEGMELALLSPDDAETAEAREFAGLGRVVVRIAEEASSTVEFDGPLVSAANIRVPRDQWVVGTRPVRPAP